MRKSWMSLIITFALGVTVGLAVGYSKPRASAEAPIELFTGQSVVVIQPVGPPGSKQYAERRLRIVRIRPLQQERTPGITSSEANSLAGD